MKLKIEIPQGANGPEARTLEPGRYLIGRSPECDVSFGGAGSEPVSWNHAEIDVTADGAYLNDLQSSNGTWLNGRRIPVRTKVLDGDEIRLGQTGPVLRIERFGGETFAAAAQSTSPAAAGPLAFGGGTGITASPFTGPESRTVPPLPMAAPDKPAHPAAHQPPALSPSRPSPPPKSVASSSGSQGNGENRGSTTRAMLIQMQRSQRGWRGAAIGVGAFLSIGVIAAIIVLVVKSGPDSGSGGARGNGGSSPSSDLNLAAISDNYRESVFLVAGMQGTRVIPLGTSFVIDPAGTFGTNAHVTELVKGLLGKRVKLFVIGEGGKLKLEILSATSHWDYKEKLPAKTYSPDVGLLKVKVTEGVALRPVELGGESDMAELKDGTRLCYIGFPVYFDAAGGDATEYATLAEVKPRIQAGNVVRMLTLKAQVGTVQTQFIMEHNMQSWGGASGSPIFNRHGRVVALHFAANPVVNKTQGGFLVTKSPAGTKFGIRVDKLRELLERQAKTPPQKI